MWAYATFLKFYLPLYPEAEKLPQAGQDNFLNPET